jgi:hypothetical protein
MQATEKKLTYFLMVGHIIHGMSVKIDYKQEMYDVKDLMEYR